jgi:parallel beta-helix repeat protein
MRGVAAGVATGLESGSKPCLAGSVEVAEMKRLLLPFLIVVPALCAPVFAHVIFVSKTAPGPLHDGASWETACLTVSAGISASTAGDEIWVAKETYRELVNVTKGVALYGGFAGTETDRSQRDVAANPTVLDGEAKGTVVTSTATGAGLDGFTVRNCGAAFKGVHVSSGTALLANNTITAHKGPAIYLQARATLTDNVLEDNDGAGITIAGSTATLTGNTVSGCRNGGIVSSGTLTLIGNTVSGNTYGVAVTGGSATLRNNVITHNESYGVRVTSGAATLTGNTICGNIGNGVSASSGTTHLTNNIVAFNTTYGVYKGTYATVGTVSHNDAFGNTTANYSGIADPSGTNGNMSADPLLVDRPGGDCRLQTGSPCIDAGTDAAVLTDETDRDGNPRINGPHVDMGAYEYTAPVAPFTGADVARCLGVACGTIAASEDDMARLGVESGSAALDLLDAVRIARKVSGLEPNP